MPNTFRLVIETDGETADLVRTDGSGEREPVADGETVTQSVTIPRASAEELIEAFPAALNVSEALRMAAHQAICSESD